MRISDWSSDVCSSDLEPHAAIDGPARARIENLRGRAGDACNGDGREVTLVGKVPALDIDRPVLSGIEPGIEVKQFGRASGRERVCKYVYILVVVLSLKNKKKQSYLLPYT